MKSIAITSVIIITIIHSIGIAISYKLNTFRVIIT